MESNFVRYFLIKHLSILFVAFLFVDSAWSFGAGEGDKVPAPMPLKPWALTENKTGYGLTPTNCKNGKCTITDVNGNVLEIEAQTIQRAQEIYLNMQKSGAIKNMNATREMKWEKNGEVVRYKPAIAGIGLNSQHGHRSAADVPKR
jgi:hypothetical protein